MSLLGDIVSIVSPSAGEKIDKAWDDVKQAVGDAGTWVNNNIIKPIEHDPLRFIAVAAAYTYGIPGLDFLGTGAAAAGAANFAAGVAEGESFDQAAKDGLTTFVVSTGVNYATDLINGAPAGSTPTVGGHIPVETTPGGIQTYDLGTPSNLSTLSDTGGVTTSPVNLSSSPQSFDMGAQGTVPNAPSGLEMAGPNSAQPGGMSMNEASARFDPTSNAPAASAANPANTPAAPANEVYSKAPGADVPNPSAQTPVYEQGYANQNLPKPSPMTPEQFEYYNRPVEGTGVDGGPPVYDRVLGEAPPQSDLTFGKVADLGSAAAEDAWSLAKNAVVEHPYYTLGGLALIDAYNKDKEKDKDKTGGTKASDVAQNTGFYQSLPQLEMKQTYNPYGDDIYAYGQTGGEHQFLTSPVYVPVQYADGGPVGIPDGDPTPQPNLQGPAVGAMMAPTQPPAQQPMGALGQVSSMASQPSPIAPNLGRPPVPQQAPRLGAPQQVRPQQQNPAYRYFSYGQIPPTVGAPLQPVVQTPQNKAVGGLMMAQGGNVADGRTDNIPAMLSPGEYVMDAETVALLGNGNNDAGAKRLDQMREAVRKQKGGALSKGKISPDAQSPLAYLSRRMA